MRILTVTITYESDVVLARQRARQIAGLLGFEAQDQTRIATAVSEIARNAFAYADGGNVQFELEGETTPQIFLIEISDQGPGIKDLQTVLNGSYQSPTGMGVGLLGARRLMDQCEILTTPGQGTIVRLKKPLPSTALLITPSRFAHLSTALTQQHQQDPFAEMQRQNQELLHTLAALRDRQEDLLRLNHELEDTNRGVVALYAELDEKAEYLGRADELKTRFLSNMSHEFRTPVNSILALSHLLLDRIDGELTAEQAKQVRFIRQAAEALEELVNDLLDIAKIEAGKITLKPVEFEVSELFSSLRGMVRPLLVSDMITLHFAEPRDLPPLYTDEQKVAQILRNFLSNALKFTERGEVRVSAALTSKNQAVVFSVADTGIGIAPHDQALIFQEFTQVENSLQKQVKGTGLGLPLCKKLAELLGGKVSVHSTLGVGSTFSVTLPLRLPMPPSEPRVLIIDDEDASRYILRQYLDGIRCIVSEATSGPEGLRKAHEERPQLVFLDLSMPDMDGSVVLEKLTADPVTKDIPVIINTSKTLQEDELAWLRARARMVLSKSVLSREVVAGLVQEIGSGPSASAGE